MVHDSKQNPGANHIMNRIFCTAFQLYLVTLKYNNSTGIEVYEHFILQEAGYVPCIPLTRISSEISLFHWSKESSVHKRMYYHGLYTKCNLLLFAIGGIECNPGPRSIKYPCGSCNKACRWNQKSVACDKCDQWFHTACMGISTSMYETFKHISIMDM